MIISAYFIGIVAGLLKVEGGFMIGSLAMVLGCQPLWVSYFVGVVTQIQSFVKMVHFSVEGAYIVKHAIYYALIGFLASLVGVLLIRRVLVGLKKTEILIWIMLILLVTTLGLEVSGLFRRAFFEEATRMFGLGDYCKDI